MNLKAIGDDRPVMKLILPIRVPAGMKKGKPYTFSLNLNSYRNEHYQILNKAKQNYHFLVIQALGRRKRHPCKLPVIMDYTLYMATKHK